MSQNLTKLLDKAISNSPHAKIDLKALKDLLAQLINSSNVNLLGKKPDEFCSSFADESVESEFEENHDLRENLQNETISFIEKNEPESNGSNNNFEIKNGSESDLNLLDSGVLSSKSEIEIKDINPGSNEKLANTDLKKQISYLNRKISKMEVKLKEFEMLNVKLPSNHSLYRQIAAKRSSKNLFFGSNHSLQKSRKSLFEKTSAISMIKNDDNDLKSENNNSLAIQAEQKASGQNFENFPDESENENTESKIFQRQSTSTSVSDVYGRIRLEKEVEANSLALKKLSNLVDNLMEEVGEKSDQIANIREKIDDIQSIRPEEGITTIEHNDIYTKKLLDPVNWQDFDALKQDLAITDSKLKKALNNENKELSSKIKFLWNIEDAFEKTSKQLQSLENDKENLTSTQKMFQKDISDLKNNIGKMNKDFDELKTLELNSDPGNGHEFKKLLDPIETQITLLRKELQDFKNETERRNNNILSREETKKDDDFNQQIAPEKISIHELSSKVVQLSEKMSRLESELQKINQVSILAKRNDFGEKSSDLTEVSSQALKDPLPTANTEIKNLTKSLSNLNEITETNFSVLNSEINSLKEIIGLNASRALFDSTRRKNCSSSEFNVPDPNEEIKSKIITLSEHLLNLKAEIEKNKLDMKSISGNVSTSKFDAKEIESQSLKINLISSKFESQGDEFAKKFQKFQKNNDELKSECQQISNSLKLLSERFNDKILNDTIGTNDSLQEIRNQLSSTVDKNHFSGIRNKLERQITELKSYVQQKCESLQKNLGENNKLENAAGVKNPYFILNCISCDRKVKNNYNRKSITALPRQQDLTPSINPKSSQHLEKTRAKRPKSISRQRTSLSLTRISSDQQSRNCSRCNYLHFKDSNKQYLKVIRLEQNEKVYSSNSLSNRLRESKKMQI